MVLSYTFVSTSRIDRVDEAEGQKYQMHVVISIENVMLCHWST